MHGFPSPRICLRPVFRPMPGPRRQFLRHGGGAGGGHGRRSFHYQPNQMPYYHQAKPKAKVARDMALGSALTATAYFLYTFYRYRRALRDLGAEADAMRRVYAEFAQQFTEARGAGDHERLREVTFAFHRRLLAKHGAAVFEAGPLPPYPEDDELHGKEMIPAEDTLMFVEKDEDRFIAVVEVAVNLDFEEVEGRWNDAPDRLVDPADDKLGELLTRFEYQVEFWRKQDKLRGGQLVVVFALRDKFWTFSYSYDPWDSVSVISFG